MRIRRFLSSVLSWGIRPDTPLYLVRHIRLTNGILMAMTVGCFFQTSAFLLAGTPTLALSNSTALIFIWGSLALMKAGHTRSARCLLIFGGMVGAGIVTSIGGYNSQFHCVLTFGAALGVIFFSSQERGYIAGSFLFSWIVYCALELTSFKPWVGHEPQMGFAEARNLRILTFTLVWILIALGINYFLKTMQSYQERLSHASKMAGLGQMAAGVSHELNNPLAVSSMRVEQLRQLAKKEKIEREELSAIADHLQKMNDRMSAIIQGLLTFSRNSVDDHLDKVPARRMVESTLGFCSARIAAQGIQLRSSDVADGLTFWGRESQISQVLLNLLNNSIDALEGAREKWIEISALEMGEWIEIAVTDSGNGIPKHALDKIFDPFFTTKPVGMGTGLGLSISRGLVRGHGGKLLLDSEARNTRFVIRLPRARPTAEAIQAEMSAAYPVTG